MSTSAFNAFIHESQDDQLDIMVNKCWKVDGIESNEEKWHRI